MNRLDFDKRLMSLKEIIKELPDEQCRGVLVNLATAALNLWTTNGDERWLNKIEHHVLAHCGKKRT